MKTRHPGVKWSRDRWRHVTPKVKLVTPLPFRRHIFVTVTDKRIVSMDLQEKMGSPESNGHVTDDVTWPQKVKLVTPLSFRRHTFITVLDRRMVNMDKTMRLSSTVMEIWCLKDNGVTSLTFGITWRDDVSCTVDAVGEVMQLKWYERKLCARGVH